MREKISVAMATYNGEKYIKEQIESILSNLSEIDELIISDDGSTDSTLDIVKSFSDGRIRIVDGPKKGVKKNFENAIIEASGKYIFLCDQDDIWADEKVNTVLKAFEESKCPVVVHDCSIVDDNGNILSDSFFSFKKSGRGFIKNVITNTYIGCCMAFDSSLKEKILPIPGDIEMHDQWIGIIGDLNGKNCFIPDKLISYRRHESNASDCFHHYGFKKMLSNRLHLLFALIKKK